MTKTSKKGIIVKVRTGKINVGYGARTISVNSSALPNAKVRIWYAQRTLQLERRNLRQEMRPISLHLMFT